MSKNNLQESVLAFYHVNPLGPNLDARPLSAEPTLWHPHSFTKEEAKVSNKCIKFLNPDYMDRELLHLKMNRNLCPEAKDSFFYYQGASLPLLSLSLSPPSLSAFQNRVSLCCNSTIYYLVCFLLLLETQ